jgi:hypothetical protein
MLRMAYHARPLCQRLNGVDSYYFSWPLDLTTSPAGCRLPPAASRAQPEPSAGASRTTSSVHQPQHGCRAAPIVHARRLSLQILQRRGAVHASHARSRCGVLLVDTDGWLNRLPVSIFVKTIIISMLFSNFLLAWFNQHFPAKKTDTNYYTFRQELAWSIWSLPAEYTNLTFF